MFNLTIVDHIRLSFGHVVQNYTIHARAADRLARLALHARIAVLVLMGIGVGLSVMTISGGGRAVHVALLSVVALAFAVHAIVTSIAFEDRVLGHRYRANRLWLVCEGYRALLAEIHDGLLERDALLARRDALIQQFHEIHAQGAPAHDAAARTVQSQPAGRALTEEQIDQFLPESLRKGSAHSASDAYSSPHPS